MNTDRVATTDHLAVEVMRDESPKAPIPQDAPTVPYAVEDEAEKTPEG
jgi:hypothetical protein